LKQSDTELILAKLYVGDLQSHKVSYTIYGEESWSLSDNLHTFASENNRYNTDHAQYDTGTLLILLIRSQKQEV
jgi:hypothetical protein